MVMAAVITAGAYTLASLGEFAVIPPRIIPFLAVLLGMLLFAHLGVRWFGGVDLHRLGRDGDVSHRYPGLSSSSSSWSWWWSSSSW